MATTVIYNDITMYNVVTEQWDQEVFYDESGTDEIGQTFRLRFRGILHAQRAPIADSEVFISGDFSPTVFTLLAQVRAALSKPRQRLEVRIAGNTVLLVTPPNADAVEANTDVANGPKPRHVEVTPIGSSAFRVTFEIETTISDCGRTRTGNDLVLNNRWRISETMDGNHAIQRLISGTLRIAKGLHGPDRGTPGHRFKPLVIPPLEDGFKRERIAYTVEPDGVTCHYEVLDKQVHTAAPWPATRITGTYSENVSHGAYFVSEVSVRLEGDPAVDKRMLVERAIQIIDSKLLFHNLKNAAHIEHLSVVDEFGEDSAVSAHMRVKRADPISQLENGLLLPQVGARLALHPLKNARGVVDGTDYDHQRSRVPKPYGYKASSNASDWERNPVVTMFLHCYYQTPCDTEHRVGPLTPSEGETAQSSRRETSPSVTEVAYTPTIVDQFNSYSEATAEGMYTMAEMSSRYHYNDMTLQLPVADGGNGANSEIVQVAPTQCYRYVEVNLERVNAQPQIPNPLASYSFAGVKAVRKHFDLELLPPIRSPDGTQQVHRSIAKYLYLLDRPPALASGLPVGVNPVTAFPGYDGKITPDTTGNMGLGSGFTNS